MSQRTMLNLFGQRLAATWPTTTINATRLGRIQGARQPSQAGCRKHTSSFWSNRLKTSQQIFRPLIRQQGKIRTRGNVQPARRHNSTNTQLNSPKPLSLSERLKKLSREYGYAAVGVYLGLSAIDLPLCYIGVSWAGAERVAALEHWVIEGFWHVVQMVLPNIRPTKQESHDGKVSGDATDREGGAGWGVEEAQAQNKSADASFWTQLALAYAIHKSFIFIRVPLTAAITPKIVKTLRGWGWNIGKRRPKPVKPE